MAEHEGQPSISLLLGNALVTELDGALGKDDETVRQGDGPWIALAVDDAQMWRSSAALVGYREDLGKNLFGPLGRGIAGWIDTAVFLDVEIDPAFGVFVSLRCAANRNGGG